MKKTILMSAVLGVSIICFAFMPDKKPWNVPDKDAKVANPVKSSAESIAAGKELYAKKCASCHGKTGLGDGTKASELKTEPGDFSKAAFQSQSDGAIFYKIAESCQTYYSRDHRFFPQAICQVDTHYHISLFGMRWYQYCP